MSFSASGEGADRASLSGFTGGGGVNARGIGEEGAGAGTETTMICSPRVMGIVERVSWVRGRGLGG